MPRPAIRWTNIWSTTPLAWQARLEGIEADIVCVGHSHVQFHLDIDGVQVLNPGSVGQPRDGDPRCAYAVIEDGKVHLRRVEYDIDATVAHMRGAGLNGTVLEMAESALRTGGRLPVNSQRQRAGCQQRPAALAVRATPASFSAVRRNTAS